MSPKKSTYFFDALPYCILFSLGMTQKKVPPLMARPLRGGGGGEGGGTKKKKIFKKIF